MCSAARDQNDRLCTIRRPTRLGPKPSGLGNPAGEANKTPAPADANKPPLATSEHSGIILQAKVRPSDRTLSPGIEHEVTPQTSDVDMRVHSFWSRSRLYKAHWSEPMRPP